jgi:hypothetical protein
MLCLADPQVQQRCSEAIARKAVAAAVSSMLQQAGGMPSPAAIADVVGQTTACAERAVKFMTSLIMQGYQPAAAAASPSSNSAAAATAAAAAVTQPLQAGSSNVGGSSSRGGGGSDGAAVGTHPMAAAVQAVLHAMLQLPAQS